jgi:hypothetical protein
MVNKDLLVKLEFTLPKGTYSLKLYAICDSYVGADHNITLDACFDVMSSNGWLNALGTRTISDVCPDSEVGFLVMKT